MIGLWYVLLSALGVDLAWKDKWYIIPTMLAGSMVAGSTAEGGGAVAFPVLTLLFHITPAIARDFTFMIQSVGMTAASLSIIKMRLKVDWTLIGLGIVGAIPGLLVGISFLSNVLSAPFIKMFFVSWWLGFGVTLWFTAHARTTSIRESLKDLPGRQCNTAIIGLGFLGGAVSGMTGSGLDIILFSFVVMVFRLRVDVATRSSIILMAMASIIGFIFRHFNGGIATDTWHFWYLAAPIVVAGAPLGVWIMRNQKPALIANVLIAIIVIQFVGALFVLQMDPKLAFFAASVAMISLCSFLSLSKLRLAQ